MIQKNTVLKISALIAVLWCLLGTALKIAAQNEQMSGDILILSPFEINTQSEGEYQATSAISAHIAELSMDEIPISMNIFTEDLLQDLGVFTTDDFGIVVPGASNSSLPEGEDRGIRLRGFNSPTYTDGYNVMPRFDAFWVERTEVAKGPAAVLYGSGATGGVVNQVLKKAKYDPLTKVFMGVGDNQYFRTYIDSTGPLDGQDGAWAYRFIGHFREIGSQIQDDFDQDISIYTSVRGTFWDKKVVLDLTYGRFESSDNNQRTGLPTNALADPQGRFPVFPDSDSSQYVTDKYGLGAGTSNAGPQEFLDYDLDYFQAEAVFKANDQLTFRAGFTDFVSELRQLGLSSVILFVAEEEFNTQPRSSIPGNANVNGDLRGRGQQAFRFDALWEPEFLGMQHKIVASWRGVRNSGKAEEWTRRRIRIRRTQEDVDRGYYTVPDQLLDVLFGPLEGITELNTLARSFPSSDRYTIDGREIVDASIRSNQTANLVDKNDFRTDISLTDHITFLNGRAHLLGGISYIKDPNTHFDADYAYQIGTIFEAFEGIHPFINYSTDFNPVEFQGEFGLQQATTDGDGIDFGLRFNLMEGKLNGSVAYFVVERSNIPRRFNVADDPTTPEDEATSFFILSGQEENKGWEISLDYNPTPNWNINFQGSFSDPKIVSNDDDPRLVGQPMEDTIPDAMTFGTRYTFLEGNLSDVSFGINGWWRAEGLTESRYVRRFRHTTEHTVVNFFVSKDLQLFDEKVDATIRLDIQNIFDEDDALRSQSTYQRGRVVFGSVRLAF